MDYFQGVVTEYLRADRAVFVNSQCLLQLDSGGRLEAGRHWYCDLVALNLREETVYLCEITYDVKVNALVRLTGMGRPLDGARGRDSARLLRPRPLASPAVGVHRRAMSYGVLQADPMDLRGAGPHARTEGHRPRISVAVELPTWVSSR